MQNIDLSFLEDQAEEASQLGQEWVERYQAYRRLMEGQKTFISDIKNRIASEVESKGRAVTEQKLERLALANPEYVKFTETLCQAEAASLKAKIKFETAKNKFEAKRSWVSLEKARMNLV